jgi:hypothetical protein
VSVFAASFALLAGAASYAAYPRRYLRTATADEVEAPLPGDALVPTPRMAYTLAVSVLAPPERVWPWLVQMGQGRGGFYTHELVEHLLGAHTRSASEILPELQALEPGDAIRLTPDPWLGLPGHQLVAEVVDAPRALVLRQRFWNGSTATWSFVLREAWGGTRLLFRRRADHPSTLERLAAPGCAVMDAGMLHGIRRRAEHGYR